MSLRHSWKGYLKLSLVTVAVKAYPAATSSGGEIHFHQLHASCKSRIRYQKTCPLHGEVSAQDIVSGYEFAKDQYVVVDTEDLEQLRSETDKAIQIDAFITPGILDPIYANGKSYYLVPDGPVAQKAYAVLRQGMLEEKRQAVAKVVWHGKDQIVWLRPLEGLLVMTQLSYEAQLTKPAGLADQVAQADILPQELNLVRTLIAACTPRRFELGHYQDQYTANLAQLIEAKVAGRQIVAPVQEPLQVINLMEALQKSVAQAQKAAKPAAPAVARAKKTATSGKAKTARSKKPAHAMAG